MSTRLVILVTSPRTAPGLLTREAWQTLAGLSPRDAVFGVADDPQTLALIEAGVAVSPAPALDPAALARELVAATQRGVVVWVGSGDGDPGLNEAIATEVTRLPEPPEVELLIGSFDVTGARLLDVVAVMDRLRSPGGCPWDAEQTHESLVPYLLEESHEVIEAIETGDREHLREELGDLLLQVMFHSRVGQEHPTDPFGVDEVAGGLVEKLVHRHPHVFGDAPAADVEAVERSWESIKAQEKPHRTHPLEGVPPTLPSLARAQKIVSRLEKAGRGDVVEAWATSAGVGGELLQLVRKARSEGVDAEGELRSLLRRLEEALSDGIGQ